MEFLIYPISGMCAGLLAGLFGIGGGLVVVPVLASVFAWQQLAPLHTMQLALGTSLSTIVFTAAVSTWSHQRLSGVIWRHFIHLLPGILVGSWLGAALADRLASSQLQWGFGLVECALGIYMLLRAGVPEAPQGASQGLLAAPLAGLAIGGLSSLGGIGGGTITVPYLTACGIAARRAVATAAACGLPIAVAGSISYVYWGWSETGLPPWSTGYVYWPAALGIVAGSALFAPFGARLAHRLPAAVLKRGFGLLLLVMGAKMLLF